MTVDPARWPPQWQWLLLLWLGGVVLGLSQGVQCGIFIGRVVASNRPCVEERRP